jgi:hypothetical protein
MRVPMRRYEPLNFISFVLSFSGFSLSIKNRSTSSNKPHFFILLFSKKDTFIYSSHIILNHLLHRYLRVCCVNFSKSILHFHLSQILMHCFLLEIGQVDDTHLFLSYHRDFFVFILVLLWEFLGFVVVSAEVFRFQGFFLRVLADSSRMGL